MITQWAPTYRALNPECLGKKEARRHPVAGCGCATCQEFRIHRHGLAGALGIARAGASDDAPLFQAAFDDCLLHVAARSAWQDMLTDIQFYRDWGRAIDRPCDPDDWTLADAIHAADTRAIMGARRLRMRFDCPELEDHLPRGVDQFGNAY